MRRKPNPRRSLLQQILRDFPATRAPENEIINGHFIPSGQNFESANVFFQN